MTFQAQDEFQLLVCSFSRDGTVIAAGSNDCATYLWHWPFGGAAAAASSSGGGQQPPPGATAGGAGDGFVAANPAAAAGPSGQHAGAGRQQGEQRQQEEQGIPPPGSSSGGTAAAPAAAAPAAAKPGTDHWPDPQASAGALGCLGPSAHLRHAVGKPAGSRVHPPLRVAPAAATQAPCRGIPGQGSCSHGSSSCGASSDYPLSPHTHMWQELVRLAGHRNDVILLYFSNAGDRLATGSKDGTVRVGRCRGAGAAAGPPQEGRGGRAPLLALLPGPACAAGACQQGHN